MSKYRSVPWKRNIRKIPIRIQTKIDRSEEDKFFVVAATRHITRGDIDQGTFNHLGIKVGSDNHLLSTNVVPPENIGPYSTKNREGWTVVRYDLPMITKTFRVETPNFGDWSYGSHTVSWDREVYQREYYEPRDIPIIMDVLRSADDEWIVRFTVGYALERNSEDFKDDFLFCLNLLQENTGIIDVYPETAPPEEYLAAIHLEWQIFPPGTVDEIVSRMIHTTSITQQPEYIETMRKRIRVFSRLDPSAYVYGIGGMQHYIGAKFDDDLVVFENVRYGNAIYILYENWEEVSKRSRTELLKGTDANFDRIIHSTGWEDRLIDLIRDKRPAKAA